MVTSPSIAEEIIELKRSRKAVILAHDYQDGETQALDGLAPRGELSADIIARARLPIERMLAVQ